MNFYRYRIADVKHNAAYASLFGQLYASDANPWDANRTELIREELDPTSAAAQPQPFMQPPPGGGNPVTVAPEIVAEYAVDLKFEVTFVNSGPICSRRPQQATTCIR